uniref:Nipped-B protein n=1 Tax=Onchocerca flexuosa TaxID=387005 RepID=A0A183HF56_9BILA
LQKEEILCKTKRLSTSIETINEQSRRFSVTSKSSISSRQSRLSILSVSEEISADQIKRLEEFEKTINLLMNSLDVGFIWNFLERKLKILIQQKQKEQQNGATDPHLLTNEVKMLKEEEERRMTQELTNFPQIVLFCLNTIELDSHGDIRERYLPQLLSSILTTLAEKDVASIDGQLLVRLLIVAKAILNEINQSAVVMEAGIVTRKRGEVYEIVRCEEFDSMEKPSTESGAIKEQWRVENCLSSCQRLLSQICDWYCKERDTERLQAFYAISILTREFADFPLYDLNMQEINGHCKQHVSSNYPVWLSALLNILSIDEWDASVNSKG